MKQFYYIAILFLILSGCCKKETLDVEGMRATYISTTELLQFEQLPPQPIVNAGKIMLYSNYLFLGEVNKGIHVIDVSDTINPQKISFLKVPGNKDIVAQNNRLYADNGPHLLVLNISDIYNIILVERNYNVFLPSESYPPDYAGYFECVDTSKGWLIEWETEILENPECKI